MKDDNLLRLLDLLGYVVDNKIPPWLQGDRFDEVRQRLIANPAQFVDYPPDLFGPHPRRDQVEQLRDYFIMAFDQPAVAARHIEAARSKDPRAFSLPQEDRFPGYSDAEIQIHMWQMDMEDADVVAWGITAAVAAAYRIAHRPPDFRAARGTNGFVYPLQTKNGHTTVALFSDWGTGYYHSKYIAKHIGLLQPAQAIHLGDVYYTASEGEFAANFRSPLEKYVLATTPMYALNANHEMMHNGITYYAFLDWKKQFGTQEGHVPQLQEGSYFCLENDRYQVIGLDTAFFDIGRFKESDRHYVNPQYEWLKNRLSKGRAAQKINIVLTQDEAYGPSELPSEDPRVLLTDMVPLRAFIDFWFWGNQHYCALYKPAYEGDFVGSCIGHGGYPYYRRSDPFLSHRRPSQYVWGETSPRFPYEIPGARHWVGNNGFCLADLEADQVTLKYIDWRLRLRLHVNFKLDGDQVGAPEVVYKGAIDSARRDPLAAG